MSDVSQMLAALTHNGGTVKTIRAKVSAYREDGLVNLSYGTNQMFGIPCLTDYTSRAVGDVVQVLNLGQNAWLVLGRIGPPDIPVSGPSLQNSGYSQYAVDTLLSRGKYDTGYEGYVGARGARGDVPVLLAWSYYNGSSNTLISKVAGKTSAQVAVVRSNLLHGQRAAVNLQLCPHNYNTLPSGTTPIVLDTDTFSPVNFRLEIGEWRMLQLPADWLAALQAATPTIKGFAVKAVTTDPWQLGYATFSATSGGIRAI